MYPRPPKCSSNEAQDYKRKRYQSIRPYPIKQQPVGSATGLNTEEPAPRLVGHSTSHRGQHQHPPESEDEARRRVPLQQPLPPAANIDAAQVASNDGSTERWNITSISGSGNAVGAGQIASAFDRRVEPSKDSMSSLMNSMTGVFRQQGRLEKIKVEEVEMDSAPSTSTAYLSTYDLAHPSELTFDASMVLRQQEEHTDIVEDGSHLPAEAVYAQLPVSYAKSSLSLSLSGHISTYSSLAGALSPSPSHSNATPPSSVSLSLSASVSASSPSSQSASMSSLSLVAPSSSSAPSSLSSLSSSLSEPAMNSLGAPASLAGEHSPYREIGGDVASVSMGNDVDANTPWLSAPANFRAVVQDDSTPQMGEESPQPFASSVAIPSSSRLASDTQTSMSGQAANTHVDYLLTSSMANRTVESAAPDALPRAVNNEELSLQTAQQSNGMEITDIRSPFTSPDSGTLPAPASSPSTLPHPTVPTTSLSSSSASTSIQEGRESVRDAALLAWLIRNLSPAAFAGLIRQSFLLVPQNSASNSRMLREAAQRHGIASEDVKEFMERVFRGAIELVALVDYGIPYEDMDWLIPRTT